MLDFYLKSDLVKKKCRILNWAKFSNIFFFDRWYDGLYMCDGISKYQKSQTNVHSLTFYYHSCSFSPFYLFFREFPDHFDESKLFQGNSDETKKLKIEFRDHFRNISKIMDCVGCDKCKLWGKIQVWYFVCFLFIFSKLLTLTYLYSKCCGGEKKILCFSYNLYLYIWLVNILSYVSFE